MPYTMAYCLRPPDTEPNSGVQGVMIRAGQCQDHGKQGHLMKMYECRVTHAFMFYGTVTFWNQYFSSKATPLLSSFASGYKKRYLFLHAMFRNAKMHLKKAASVSNYLSIITLLKNKDNVLEFRTNADKPQFLNQH